jgi:tRNA wybutosine-synthesizing protein 1
MESTRRKEEERKELENALMRKQYRLYGNAAVQICLWTKKALRGEGVCYKQKFYGIECKRCMQFTPFIFCQQNCIHCWRPKELLRSNIKKISEETKLKVDENEIVERLIEERKKLLIGFGGNKKVKKEMLADALVPNHFAISLVGDPLLYPRLAELIRVLKNKYKAKSIFVVTNCQEPQALKRLIQKDCLPTQLYLSINATNEKDFVKLNRPLYKDAWQRFLAFLKVAKKVKCRKVVRYTLIRGINDKQKNIAELKELVKLSDPDFIEVKGYMHIGYSKQRLEKAAMPLHKDVKDFSFALAREIGFNYANEDPASRVVLLKHS